MSPFFRTPYVLQFSHKETGRAGRSNRKPFRTKQQPENGIPDCLIILRGGVINDEIENEEYHENASVQHSTAFYLHCHICSAGKHRLIPGRYLCCIFRLCSGASVLCDRHDQDWPKLCRPSALLRNAEQAETEKQCTAIRMRKQQSAS